MKNRLNIVTSPCKCTLLIVLLIPTFISGCAGSAINRKENYSLAWPNITYSFSEHVLVGVIDKRPYITNGKLEPSYVGLMRGGFGNPWYMHTESGKPLADDLSQAVVSGFKNSGIDAESVKLSTNINESELNKSFLLRPSAKKLLLSINEWKSDTFTRTRFLINITAKVYDENGSIVGEITEGNTNEREENQMVVSGLEAGRSSLTTLLNNKILLDGLSKPLSATIRGATDITGKEPPDNIKKEIKHKCSSDFPSDYARQAECVKKQETGWMEINR